MKLAVPLACILLIGTGILAQTRVAPRISAVFPPPEDIRKPDLTIAVGSTPVSMVSYDANGWLLATVGANGAIKMWEARTGEQGTGELVRELAGSAGSILALAPGTTPNLIVAITSDHLLKSWDETTGALVGSAPLKISLEPGHVIFLSGKEPLVATWKNAAISVWNYETGALVRTIELRDEKIASLAFSADGRMLATGSADGTVKLWDASTGALTRTISAHAAAVNAVALDARAEQVATAGGGDNTVKVWDVQTGALLCRQDGHTAAPSSLSFASNGQKLASGAADGTARLWTVPLPPIPADSLAKITVAAASVKATATPQRPRRILVLWRADAILHKSGVPAVNDAIELLGHDTGAFESDFSRDFEVFDPNVLSKYDAIVLNSTAHLVMPDYAKKAYLDYVNAGGGVIAIHAAIDTFLPWPEGAKVVGATFGDHPWGPNGTWAVKLEEPEHPLLRAFGGKNFKIRDEFYVMGEPFTRADRRVLMSVDLSDPASASVNLAGDKLRAQDHDFALAWVKHYGKGRVFYADFGHIDEPFWRREILQFYLDGIQYVLGDLKVDDAPKR